MITLVFQKQTQVIAIVIQGHSVMFGEVRAGGTYFAPIEGLKLSIAGILKEFPDLEGKPVEEIKREAIKRFKEKIKSFGSEKEIAEYIVDDLGKHGYVLKIVQKKGFRPIKVNGKLPEKW